MRHIVLAALLLVAIRARADVSLPHEQSRAAAAAEVYAAVEAQFQAGIGSAETVYLWSLRWYDAARSSRVKTAAADHLKRMQALEAAVKARVQTGALRGADALAANYYRVEAEALAARK